MNCLFLSTSLVNIASVISLVALLIWSSTLFGDEGRFRDADRWNGGDNYGGQGGWDNGGGGSNWNGGQQQQNSNNWWTNPEGQLEFRMDRTDRLAFKLMLDLAALILVNVMVAGKSWSIGDGGRYYEKANLGSLSGSMYMLANMLLVSFLYLLNFNVSPDYWRRLVVAHSVRNVSDTQPLECTGWQSGTGRVQLQSGLPLLGQRGAAVVPREHRGLDLPRLRHCLLHLIFPPLL